MVGKSFPQPQDDAALAQSMVASASIIKSNQASASADVTGVENAATAEAASIPAPSVNKRSGLNSWSFSLMALLACTMTGGTAAIAFLSLTALPPETDCNQSAAVVTDRGLLYCVQQAAQSGEMEQVLEGLSVLGQWTPSDPLYYEAQSSIGKWSRIVLSSARQKLRNNELDEAIALVQKVPQSSPLYEESQELLASWEGQADQAQSLLAAAQDALQKKDWNQVSAHIKELGGLRAYSNRSQKVQQLSIQLQTEKENEAIFQEVLQLARQNKAPAIGLALEKAATMDQDTYVWASAQQMLQPMAARLLEYGGLQWKQGHLDNALVTAKRVSLFESLASEAQNLERLTQARKLAIATVTNWVPSHEHLFNLLEATAAVRQIPTSSQFYAQAQDSLKSWESQFADVSHLQLAKMSAQVGWAPTVEWAANQAEQLSPERPRRVQAQTLAAHWNLELERIKDRRHLLWANQLAEPGTRASLKMAITEAKKIEGDRPLFGEAQGLIYSWTRDIQTQEDQPYLTLAETLARQGELREAIKTAGLVKPNRPLYNSARSMVNKWQQQIWAQQQAEQRRLARRNRSRQTTVRQVSQPSPEKEPKPVANSGSTSSQARGSEPSPVVVPVVNKAPSSPATLPQPESRQPQSNPVRGSAPSLDGAIAPISSPVERGTTSNPVSAPTVTPAPATSETPALVSPVTPDAAPPSVPSAGEEAAAPEVITPSTPVVAPAPAAPAPVPVVSDAPVPPAPAPVVAPPSAPAPAPVVAPAPASTSSAPEAESVSLNSAPVAPAPSGSGEASGGVL